jgi:hypothetical protein
LKTLLNKEALALTVIVSNTQPAPEKTTDGSMFPHPSKIPVVFGTVAFALLE